ncbi:MAG: hypothetical protein PHV93_00410 [Candidatus Pacebacteria bacterium]|nr:hypothetical protein [Candidatus Paceibacterota bacterium]
MSKEKRCTGRAKKPVRKQREFGTIREVDAFCSTHHNFWVKWWPIVQCSIRMKLAAQATIPKVARGGSCLDRKLREFRTFCRRHGVKLPETLSGDQFLEIAETVAA